MEFKSENDFLYTIYQEIENNLFSKESLPDNINDIIWNILIDNGCKATDFISSKSVSILTNNSFILLFVDGMLGNDINQCFDVIEIHDSKVVVIFRDYFTDVISYDPDDGTPEKLMGNSNFFNGIVAIIRQCIELYYIPTISSNTTARATMLRESPILIAANLINKNIRALKEEDVDGNMILPYDKILDLITEYHIKILLLGIRTF